MRPVLFGGFLLFWSGTALAADNRQDVAACFKSKDIEVQIQGCTRLINAGTLSRSNQVAAHGRRASAFQEKGELDRAIADFSEVLRHRPQDAATYNNRAIALTSKREFERALVDLNEAIRLTPRDYVPYVSRARVWNNIGNPAQAISDLDQAIRLNPKDTAGFHNRALIWRDLGDFDRALADFNEALKLKDNHGHTYANRGEIWRLKGDLDSALADQDRAIQFDPKNILTYVKRGDTLRYKGELARALADYDRALLGDSNFAPAYVGRGLAFEKLGDLTRARVEFEKAVNSPAQDASDLNWSSRQTARARLAAFDSGLPQPVIPAAPRKAETSTAIPTPVAVAPARPVASLRQGRRVALIVGNSAYRSVSKLVNPQRDAQAIAASLRASGFDAVQIADDASRESLTNALRTFADEAEKADWAMVYYAGHGIEVGGMNYLIPVDAKLASDRDVQFEAVPLDQVMAAVDGAKKLKLVLLDACRDNPFAPQMRKTAPSASVAAVPTAGAPIATRSVGRGLGEVKVSGATLVVYAAKHGQVALDGEGGNSPFAVAVVQRLATPNVEINKLFRLVRDDVMEATAGRQEPYTYGSLPGREDFFFVEK